MAQFRSSLVCSTKAITKMLHIDTLLDRSSSHFKVPLSFVSCIHSSSKYCSDGINSDYVVNPVYHNRNPRNLERLGHARKRLGWKFQSPRKDYYHKLVLQQRAKHINAWVEHANGHVVVSASTSEIAIGSQLHSLNDVTACTNVGRVLAQRCLESGISSIFLDVADESDVSEKVSSFIEAFKDCGIELQEPETIVPEYRPGVNYDGYNRYDETKEWKENHQDI